jgi:hypothetical protein
MADTAVNRISYNQGHLIAFLAPVQCFNVGQGLNVVPTNGPAAKAADAMGWTITMPTIHESPP